MQANYFNSVLQQDDNNAHLCMQHNNSELDTVKIKMGKNGIKNISQWQYYASDQRVQQMKICQPQNDVPNTILNSGGTVTFDLKTSIGNAHLIKQMDLVIYIQNTNPNSAIQLLPGSQFLSSQQGIYFSDGSDNVSISQSCFANYFMNLYNINTIQENSRVIEYRNTDPNNIGSNFGITIPAASKVPIYIRVRNPYSSVPIKSIRGDFYLNFNFSGDIAYNSQFDQYLLASQIYLQLTTEQLPQNCLVNLLQNPVSRINPVIVTKYIPLQQTLQTNNQYSVKVDYVKNIFGLIWFVQPQAKYNASNNYQQNQALTQIQSFDLQNDSGELISSQSNMKYDDLQYYLGCQLRGEFLLNSLSTWNAYFFCNNPQESITTGNLSSFYSLKNEGLNICFTTSSTVVSQVPQQLCVLLFSYALNSIEQGSLKEILS